MMVSQCASSSLERVAMQMTRDERKRQPNFLKDRALLATMGPHHFEEAREIAIDAMVNLCETFRLGLITAGIAVQYFDLYLAERLFPTHTWQLIATACTLISAKMWENNVQLKLDHLCQVSGNAFTIRNLQECELNILSCLDWGINLASPFAFFEILVALRQLKHDSNFDSRMSMCVIDVSLYSSKAIKYSKAVIAAAAVLCGWTEDAMLQAQLNHLSVLSDLCEAPPSLLLECKHVLLRSCEEEFLGDEPTSSEVNETLMYGDQRCQERSESPESVIASFLDLSGGFSSPEGVPLDSDSRQDATPVFVRRARELFK